LSCEDKLGANPLKGNAHPRDSLDNHTVGTGPATFRHAPVDAGKMAH
jgi:hypothetical protein